MNTKTPKTNAAMEDITLALMAAQVIESNLKPMVGAKIDVKVTARIIEANLNSLLKEPMAFTAFKASTTWGAMSWKEKLKWIAANFLFPFIGRRRRARYAEQMCFYYSMEDSSLPDHAEPPKPVLPNWAHSSPKCEVVLDYHFTPPKAADIITFTATIPKEPTA